MIVCISISGIYFSPNCKNSNVHNLKYLKIGKAKIHLKSETIF